MKTVTIEELEIDFDLIMNEVLSGEEVAISDDADGRIKAYLVPYKKLEEKS
ncbi:hypothetical protein [Dyadobacter psychrophilus]|uniref:Antitoxin Phd_YefM, type II toxin-antitoxin system n=1 Tax=Dyadobacter psychrophilus TaxID=651661 RepID=A0A1T5DT15_9BACT|nr:hypothetical protein [Dyadobacter psychrophilus]SKB74835.1 hypothetical protein SAMN05660293_01880 [Dyadobacter psychrophilus]